MKPSSKALRVLSAAIFSILLLASQSNSQTVSVETTASNGNDNQAASQASYKLNKGMNEYGIWGGFSFDSPTVIGTAEDRKFLTVGLRYGRIFGTTRRVAYEYTVDA
ncbi:MAG TPA: hypothetical protein VKB86_00390, partial [Pyrinomonadaceae bacterium]|nr:hypothetical protein [Pyrinomonadaceae bacterium]